MSASWLLWIWRTPKIERILVTRIVHNPTVENVSRNPANGQKRQRKNVFMKTMKGINPITADAVKALHFAILV